MAQKKDQYNHGEVLVALLKSVSDFTILQEQGWYRIPVASAPKRWPPKWLAFYQPKAFGNNAFRIRFWGEVDKIEIAKRKDLFPHKPNDPQAQNSYFRLSLRKLDELQIPIPSHRPRRLVFIPTTQFKFDHAEQINDLFHDSPLEDRLWEQFKSLDFQAERQWYMKIEKRKYYLDFAMFCKDGFIDIETDGDYHNLRKQNRYDKIRNNSLASIGWRVLRFDSQQIKEEMNSYCLPEIKNTINSLGGLSDDGLVPRVFYTKGNQSAQQLSLFEHQNGYNLDSGAGANLEIDL